MESRYSDTEIETASRNELRSLQERKLNVIVQHAWDHSSFYKRKFEEANINPDKIRSLDWFLGRLVCLSGDWLFAVRIRAA